MLESAMCRDSAREEPRRLEQGPRAAHEALKSTVIGKIVALTALGQPYVDFPGNERGPLEARTVVDPLPGTLREDLIQAEVLLVFDRQDSRYPLIVGFPRSSFQFHDTRSPLPEVITKTTTDSQKMSSDGEDWSCGFPTLQDTTQGSKRKSNVEIDGQKVTLKAEQEVRLSCGKSSITLRKDGKIVIQGTHLVSRAEGVHRIKGGSVKIN